MYSRIKKVNTGNKKKNANKVPTVVKVWPTSVPPFSMLSVFTFSTASATSWRFMLNAPCAQRCMSFPKAFHFFSRSGMASLKWAACVAMK